MNNIILFDGNCNLCTGTVKFIRRRDRSGKYVFVPFQSERGRELLERFDMDDYDADSVIYISGNSLYVRSSAVLQILRSLGGGWKLLFTFIIVPPPVRDFIYRIIARHRYHLFGRKESCRI
jgi:predicted DCC family thiol-disulfide oxidoreductase YuxK